MKITNVTAMLMLLAAVFGLAQSNSVLADEFDLTPKQETIGQITYLNGGIGEDEAEVMRSVAKGYPLEVVFVQKLKEQEEFIAGVKVKIQDAQKNNVLDVITDGPFLLVNLPDGKYVITAEFNSDTKQQKVIISAKKHQKVVFWWPILEQREADIESE